MFSLTYAGINVSPLCRVGVRGNEYLDKTQPLKCLGVEKAAVKPDRPQHLEHGATLAFPRRWF